MERLESVIGGTREKMPDGNCNGGYYGAPEEEESEANELERVSNSRRKDDVRRWK